MEAASGLRKAASRRQGQGSVGSLASAPLGSTWIRSDPLGSTLAHDATDHGAMLDVLDAGLTSFPNACSTHAQSLDVRLDYSTPGLREPS